MEVELQDVVGCETGQPLINRKVVSLAPWYRLGNQVCQAWWYVPVSPVVGRSRQKD